MKKIAILPILALAMGFAACDDVDLGTGIPVVNPELPAAGPDLVTVTPAADIPSVVNLAEYYERVENVPVAVVSAAEGWPEGYGFGANVEVSTTEDFATSVRVPAVALGENFYFEPAVLNEAIRETFTKNPVEITLYLRYNVSAVKGNENVVLGGPDKFYCPMQITVLPYPPYVIEPTYYFAWSADGIDWTVNNTSKFNHSDNNVYDDPSFSQVLNLSPAVVGSGVYWKIIPGSVLDNSDFSAAIGVVEADKAKAAGSLDAGSTQVPGFMTLSGGIEFKFNREKLTFEYKQAIPNIWMAGNGVNGTSWNNSQFAMVLWTEDYVNYAGYAHLYGAAEPAFKFSTINNWDGGFGVTDALEFTTNPETGVMTASGNANGGKDINVPAEGLYFIKLNYSTKAFNVTSIKTIGMISDFNGWGSSLAMTPSADMLTWTVTVDLEQGQNWKFRMNDGWDINLGGVLESLTCFGNPANIVAAETGTYEVTLHLDTLPYTATLVKK